MKATVEIEKSFDEGKRFSKDYKPGDLFEFMVEEGAYLDRLAAVLSDKGKPGESYTVTYTVKVTK